jgi:hypothetical protein
MAAPSLHTTTTTAHLLSIPPSPVSLLRTQIAVAGTCFSPTGTLRECPAAATAAETVCWLLELLAPLLQLFAAGRRQVRVSNCLR